MPSSNWLTPWLSARRVVKRKPKTTRTTLSVQGLEERTVPATFTYTSDADFNQGTLLNVNHDAPNNNQLQLNAATTPFPFVNVAASDRGTMIRIDTNTGAILGEYFTAPNGQARNPSRTTVDQFGNVWVANRNATANGQGSVTRIALIIGGTRGDKVSDGMGGWTVSPNPLGEYVQNPTYSTAVDRDGDGLIRTSRGLGNILAWTNAGGANTAGGVSTADDEAIINYVRVTGTGTRTIAIDANNDVWVGGISDRDHEKLDGVTGLPIPGTQFDGDSIPGLGAVSSGYGGVVDGNGVLWSASGSGTVLRYDTTKAVTDPTAFTRVTTGGGYGVAIDPATGNLWTTSYGNGRVYVHNPAGGNVANYVQGNTTSQGLAIDANGNVWLAHGLNYNTVGHLRTDGTYVGTVQLTGAWGTGQGPTGVAIDANGKVWVTNYYSSTVMRIDPNAGPIGAGGYPVGAVDLVVNLGGGAGPYNYSDMTGAVSIGTTAQQGTWTEVVDGGAAGTDWSNVQWTGAEPADSDIVVEVRAADSQAGLAGETFVAVASGSDPNLTGQFLEVRVTLKAGSNDESPILEDITITSTDPYEVTGFDVQKGQTQRSYVRYADITFAAGGGSLQALIDSGRIQLTRFDLNGNNGVNVGLGGMLSVSGNTIAADFGAQGLGGNRNTIAGDGYYQFGLDLDGNGSFETIKSFYRLLGDVSGNRKVETGIATPPASNDASLILAAYGTTDVERDANGDGIVNATDRTLAIRSNGRAINLLLGLDD